MEDVERPRIDASHLAVGAFLMLLGVAMLMERTLGYTDVPWRRLWPLLLVGMGLAKLAFPRRTRRGKLRRSGGWLLLVGLLLLGQTTGTVRIAHSWPVFVVAAGAQMSFRALRRGQGMSDED